MELFDIENKKLSFIPYKTDFTTITKNEKVFDFRIVNVDYSEA